MQRLNGTLRLEKTHDAGILLFKRRRKISTVAFLDRRTSRRHDPRRGKRRRPRVDLRHGLYTSARDYLQPKTQHESLNADLPIAYTLEHAVRPILTLRPPISGPSAYLHSARHPVLGLVHLAGAQGPLRMKVAGPRTRSGEETRHRAC